MVVLLSVVVQLPVVVVVFVVCLWAFPLAVVVFVVLLLALPLVLVLVLLRPANVLAVGLAVVVALASLVDAA